MEFAELKRTILGEVVRNGWTKADEIASSLYDGIEPPRVERWLDKFFRAGKPDVPPINPRLVNHFAVGADPEFAMATRDEVMIDANGMGLQAGLAFGMDTNGRLVELRPAPSRFALKVVASVLSELRWMALLMPATRKYSWISRPMFGRDGLGGHVHFGRKRGDLFREREVRILDQVADLLTRGGVFNPDMVALRRRAQGKYGAAGDFRLQKHGYEYRTMPTWLDNPWLAYLTLVISKLAVHDPGLLAGLQVSKVNVKRVVRNILAFYKGLDDDALIAYNALQVHGLPQQIGSDFRAAWGIHYDERIVRPNVDYIPSSIEATPDDVQTIFSYLLKGLAIAPIIPEPNWTPVKFPNGYQSVLDWSQTYHRVGIGELGYNLVGYRDCPIVINTTDHPQRMQISAPPDVLTVAQKVQKSKGYLKLGLPNMDFIVQSAREQAVTIYLGETLRSNNVLPKVKRFLIEGWLPIWKVDEVKLDSYQTWRAERKVPVVPVPARRRGKELNVDARRPVDELADELRVQEDA